MRPDFLLDVTIAGIRVRLDRGRTGLIVTRTQPGHYADSVAIRRWRFPAHEAVPTAVKVMDEMMAAGETESRRLRENATRAARRAFAGRSTMRAQSSALRLLEEACAA